MISRMDINTPDNRRHLCWDEENRLTTMSDKNYLSQYIYNAGGLASSVVDSLLYQVQPINSTHHHKADSLYQMLQREQTCANLDPDNVTIDPERHKTVLFL